MIGQIFFALALLITFYFAFKRYSVVHRNIFLGKDEPVEGDSSQRWKNVLLIAFGQKKMFKRIIPAIFHFFIYAAFLLTQIELIEIIIDGLFGVHRFFAPFLGAFYTFLISFIELLSIGALIATFIFLARRNALKIPRFQKSEMTWWPKLDANLILLGELALLFGIFSMNGADTVLQTLRPEEYHATGSFAVSSIVGPMLFGGIPADWLVVIERFGWWLHILTVLAFIVYLPSSKHLHIFLAFPNVYFGKILPKGHMVNMPEVMKEVKSMMGIGGTEEMAEEPMSEEIPEFGAKDIFDLSWNNILGAYSCTECGRCTAVCPANITGKKLSPRKIMMDIRDRAEEVGAKIDQDKEEGIRYKNYSEFDDGKSLFDYISREELHACTTCNACVEACPILINPLEPIIKMRRYEILTESAGPSDWVPMFTSLENNGAVWQVPDARDAWRS